MFKVKVKYIFKKPSNRVYFLVSDNIFVFVSSCWMKFCDTLLVTERACER